MFQAWSIRDTCVLRHGTSRSCPLQHARLRRGAAGLLMSRFRHNDVAALRGYFPHNHPKTPSAIIPYFPSADNEQFDLSTPFTRYTEGDARFRGWLSSCCALCARHPWPQAILIRQVFRICFVDESAALIKLLPSVDLGQHSSRFTRAGNSRTSHGGRCLNTVLMVP